MKPMVLLGHSDPVLAIIADHQLCDMSCCPLPLYLWCRAGCRIPWPCRPLMHGHHHLLQFIIPVPVWALVVVPAGWFRVVRVLGVGVLQVFGINVAWLLNRRCVLCPPVSPGFWMFLLALIHLSAHESLFATCFQLSSSMKTCLLHA